MSIPFQGQERGHYSLYQSPLSFKFEEVILLQTKLLNTITKIYQPFNLQMTVLSPKKQPGDNVKERGQDMQTAKAKNSCDLGTPAKGEIRCSCICNPDNAFQIFLFSFQLQQAYTAKNLRTSVLHTAEQHLGK